MADKDFRIDLILGAKFAEAFRALDGAKKKIGDVEKAAGKFSTGAGTAVGVGLRASATAAVAAATAATAVMGLYIAKTIEAEKVQAQLQSRLKDTGGVAGRTLEQLNQQAGSLQKITIFDDEAIGNAQAMLLTFTQIRGQNFDGAIESALDLATVMGTDAADAAKVLGKALSDPEKGLAALTKAGVTFTDAERSRIEKMMEAGQVAEAQAAILDKLSGTMGSAAEAARDTLGGAVQALKNAFDNLLEGDTGDAGIVGTRAAIESLIETLNDPEVKSGFNAMVGGLASVASEVFRGTALIANYINKYREIAALGNGDLKLPDAGDDALMNRLAAVSKTKNRLKQGGTINDLKAIYGADSVLTAGDLLKTKDEVIARLEAERTKIIREMTQRNRAAVFADVTGGIQSTYDQPSNPKPDGQGVATPGKSKASAGSKSDPDADIKRRIEGLREEVTLLGEVKEGEEQASEAAKVRYAITEGEFKNKSPQLKQELLQAAEALDAKNKDVAAEQKRKEAIKESQEAYAELMRDLRTPAQVAVDDAIAKLNTLTEAMGRGDSGVNPADVDAARKKILGDVFEKAPDFGDSQYDPFAQLAAQSAELDVWYQGELSRLMDFREKKKLTNEEYNRQEKDIEAQHQQGMQQLQFQQSQLMLGAASSLFGSLAQIARSGAGEQSKAYRAMFALSQGFAVAQALIAVYQNAAEASKKAGGWPANIPIIAGAIAQGLAIVAQIRGVQSSGFAEGGYTGAGGKYQPAGIVHRGEGVLNQQEISKLGGPGGFYQLRALIAEGELLDRMRGIAGYAAGGLVGANGPMLASPDYASYPQGADGLKANLQNDMTLYLLQDRDALAEAVLKHPKTRKAIIAEVSENGQGIKAAWGN